MRPRSIAIVGASPEPRSFGSFVLENLERFGFQNEIHLVNRDRREIGARACFTRVVDLPRGIDVAVIAIPQAGVLDAIVECGKRDVNAAVIFSSGFAETGAEGRAQQEALTAAALAGGVALVGPNCMGLTNYVDGVPLTFEPLEQGPAPKTPGIGVIAQSGAMAATIRDALRARGEVVSHSISTGNEAVLGAEDFLAYLLADDATNAIALYLEQIRRPREFLALAARARELDKPLVLLSSGRSARARDAAESHTGALAGNYAVMRTMLARQAVVFVDTLDELVDSAAVLSRFPVPRQGGTVFMTMSGALKNIALDLGEDVGLEFPMLAPATIAALGELLPPYATIENPLDVTTVHVGRPTVPAEVVCRLLDDPGVGSLVVSQVSGARLSQLDRARHLVPALAGASKPVALVIVGDEAPLEQELLDAVRDAGVPLFRSQDRALRAMARVARYAAARVQRPGAVCAPLPETVALPWGGGTLAEYQGKAWLAAAGIEIPRGRLARDADEAVRAAAEIGYPVVLKAQAAALPHKSDAGGVAVGLADEAALRAGWTRVVDSVARARPGLALDGLLVETMAERGLELVVGARRDPDWGPVLLVGLGGIWIEALADVQLLPVDLDEAGIVEALGRLKGAALLRGLRGAPAADVAGVARVVAQVGTLMRATPAVTEIDINPLVAYPDRVVALDALVVCGDAVKATC
nr:acetate--CoA ligase family protein [Thauera aromatica]